MLFLPAKRILLYCANICYGIHWRKQHAISGKGIKQAVELCKIFCKARVPLPQRIGGRQAPVEISLPVIDLAVIRPEHLARIIKERTAFFIVHPFGKALKIRAIPAMKLRQRPVAFCGFVTDVVDDQHLVL